MPSYHKLPLNLPHASTVAIRVSQRLAQLVPQDRSSEALDQANNIVTELLPYHLVPEDPNPAEAMVVQAHVLELSRALVETLEAENLKSDRLGQSIRNLFECLGNGKEGAEMGLRAGEDPKSIQRP